MNEPVIDTAQQYPDDFARFVGAAHAFPFWKGRVALYAILKSLGVGASDEVIVPGYTCVMNVNPIFYLGARPVYVDIDPASYNLDPAAVQRALTPRTKVIIAQHTYGIPADLDALFALAKASGIHVVEDCCLALGSQYQGRRLGSFGAAAYFSFQWNKPYTTGLGGMAVTSDGTLADRLRRLCATHLLPPRTIEVARLSAQLAVHRTLIYPRTTALAARAFRWLTDRGLVVGSSDASEFTPMMTDDFFKGMSLVQRSLGAWALASVERNLAHRRALASRYDQWLSEAGWPTFARPTGADPVLVRYPVRVADKARALAEAARAGLEIGSWFECPLHPIETPLSAYGYSAGQCLHAERACNEVVNLPLHPRVSERTARRSVEFILRIGRPSSDRDSGSAHAP